MSTHVPEQIENHSQHYETKTFRRSTSSCIRERHVYATILLVPQGIPTIPLYTTNTGSKVDKIEEAQDKRRGHQWYILATNICHIVLLHKKKKRKEIDMVMKLEGSGKCNS